MADKEKQIEEMDDRANDCCKCVHHRVCYKIKQYNIQQRYTGLYCPSFEPKQSEWISVEERLPEKGQKVLVRGVKNGMQIGAFRGIPVSERSELWWWKKNTLLDVTHWMPLPEPPKE